MSLSLALNETMSGWIKLHDADHADNIAFTICAVTDRIFSLTAPRHFDGTLTLGEQSFSCHGTLTIFPSGPHYQVHFSHPELGALRLEGKKTYRLGNLVHSMTTCPMEVFQNDVSIGEAELAYRDSMLAFPFKALRLIKTDSARA